MSSDRRVDPEPEAFQEEMSQVGQVFSQEAPPLEWVSEAKELIIDDYIYSEVLEDLNREVVDPLKVDLVGHDHSEQEIREAVSGDYDADEVIDTINSFDFYDRQEARIEREEKNDVEPGNAVDFENAVEATMSSLEQDSLDTEGPGVEFDDIEGEMAEAVKDTAVDDEDMVPDPEPAGERPLDESEVLDAVDDELIRDEKEMLQGIKEGGAQSDGEFYERILQLSVDIHNKGEEEAFNGSIFDDRVEASDGLGMDYVLRGGKRLRPAMTLFTEYALEGEVSHKSLLVGAAQEIIHASSLAQDDEMDGDPVRRLKLTSERINNALYGGEGYDQSMLDGNKMEAWGDKAVAAAVKNGISPESSQSLFATEADLNDGQKRDIGMEDQDLRDAELEEYEEMISGKTGALYSAGIEVMVETHLEDKDYSEAEDSNIDNEEVEGLFMEYMDEFNKLFQAGDDAIEVFRPDGSGKSVTDIVNRKITFPAINTKYGLQEENESYAELFLDVFDDAYDRVTEDMRETASSMGIEIPEFAEAGGAWEEEWITETIQEYGFETSQQKADDYLSNAEDAMERLHENSVIDEDVKQKYQEMAEFVWSREY